MRGLLGLVLILFSVAAGAHAQADSYLCITDMATGFAFNKESKRWYSTNFDVSDDKYIIAKSKRKGYKWAVTKVGEDFARWECKFDMGGNDQIYDCNPLIDPSFYFDRISLRFSVVRALGYVRPSGYIRPLSPDKSAGAQVNEGDISPYIEIGKCSPL